MVARNPHFTKLPAGYLFPEIDRRSRELAARRPEAKIISLGKGNTTEPLTPTISSALVAAAAGLGTLSGYSGYGDEVGQSKLRELIAEVYYQGRFNAAEVLISDGAKCDVGRLQFLFGAGTQLAVQDPVYPVYVDSGVMIGQSGPATNSGHFAGICYLPCRPENDFFPDLSPIPAGSVIFFCSPNNPTGAAATKEQLEQLVAYALEKRCLIVYDAAYALFIRDQDRLPRSIFDIPAARQVAIEVNSLSKTAGFAGVRLGWTVVPAELRYDDGSPVLKDWTRIATTLFNGASNLVQQAAQAVFSPAGWAETKGLVDFYMENAAIIRGTLAELDFEIYGGCNAPYIWARIPGRSSWEAFDYLLQEAQVISTPGAGFGPAGEGFLRFSAFGHRADIVEACERLRVYLRKAG